MLNKNFTYLFKIIILLLSLEIHGNTINTGIGSVCPLNECVSFQASHDALSPAFKSLEASMLIYKATCKINGKCYIGQTVGKFSERKAGHKHSSFNKNNYGYNLVFHKAIRKYGWNNFKWEILEKDIKNRKQANGKEVYWIKYFESYGSGGYNMTEGGYHVGVFNEETRKKMSDNNKGKNNFWYGKSHLLSGKNNPMYGRKHSDETKEKIRQKRLGKKLSKKTLKKLRDKLSGENNPFYGKTHSKKIIDRIKISVLKNRNYVYDLIAIDPPKTYLNVKDLKGFCYKHRLNYLSLKQSYYCTGKYKKWKIIKSGLYYNFIPYVKKKKTYRNILCLSDFCKKNNMNYYSLSVCRNNYKGWNLIKRDRV